MRSRMIGLMFVLCMAIFTVEGVCAQTDAQKPQARNQIEDMAKRIETLKMWRLIKALDMNEKTAAKVFPVINEYDKKRLVIAKGMGDDMLELRKTVNTASDGQLKTLITRLEDNNKMLQSVNDEEMKRLKDILTVKEQARLMLFNQDFDREMQRIMSGVRAQRVQRTANKTSAPAPAAEPAKKP
ncbi:MAG: hypothetical protein HY758_04325 [Nitrospirae bacterium]|nr:hypothetical protein [Nitrospirota bacterium]